MAEENAAVGAMDAVDQLGQKGKLDTGADHKSKSSSSISKPKIWGSFQRTDFRAVEGTGAQISREGRDTKTELKGEVQVTEQLHQRYHQFLKDHLVGLQRIYKTNRSLYEQMAQSQSHSYETKLLQMICDRDDRGEFQVDPEGNLIFSEERINGILANPEGWELTTMLLEQQTSYQLFALGLSAAIDPRGNRNLLLNNESIDLGIDSGVLREFYHRYLADYLEEDLPSAGGRHPGLLNRIHTPRWRALTGILIGSGLGGIIGGLPGAAVVPGLTALREVLKRGVGMDINQCAAVLDSIKGRGNQDTLEAKYLRELYHIDINDFTTQNGVVELVARSAQTTFNTQEARTQVLGNIYSRLLFYESIGVPAEQLDALPEQFLYRYLDGDPEQTSTHMQRDILDEFRPNHRGIVPNDIAGNLKRFREARVKVLTSRIEAIIQRETNKLNYQGRLTDLQTMINARENSTMVTAAKKEAQRRKDELTRQKEQLPKLESHETYVTKRQQLDDLLEAASTRAEYPIILNQGETFAQAIARQIDQINGLLRVPNLPQGQAGGLEDQLDSLNQTFNANLLQQINGFMQGLQNIQLPRGTKLPDGFIDQAVQLMTNQLTAANRAQVERLTQQIEHLKKQREELTELRKQYQTAQTELQQAEKAIIDASPKNLVTLVTAYEAIINQPGQNAQGVIDLDTLRNGSIDQLVTAVNAPNSPYLPIIPANIRQNPAELRQYLLQAKTEAVAQAVEAYDVSPAQQLADYQVFLVANPNGQLNLDSLLTMSNAQIDQILNNPQGPYQALLAQRTAREVRESLQSEARKRLRIRSRILIEAQVDDIDAQITVQDRIIDQNFTEQIQILSKTKKMAERQGQIFYSVNEIFARPTEILSNALIGNQDQTYTVSERGANIPRGYVELMNIFFGYQREVDKRDADFAEIMRILSPDRLATLLNQHCHLGLGGPINIAQSLDRLRERITGQNNQPRLSRIELQQGFAAIINQLVAQARALS